MPRIIELGRQRDGARSIAPHESTQLAEQCSALRLRTKCLSLARVSIASLRRAQLRIIQIEAIEHLIVVVARRGMRAIGKGHGVRALEQ
jgi:hypothetical protein